MVENSEQAVVDQVKQTIGDPSTWAAWPGGWPDDIESALIDSIFSARTRYAGVHAALVNWQGARGRKRFSVEALRAEIQDAGADAWAKQFGNRQHSPGRRDSEPGGPSKAATVSQACGVLESNGILGAADISPDNAATVRSMLLGVPGLGYATANYFFMLLGAPGVKPDRMVHRFLTNAIGRKFSDSDAEELIRKVALRVGVEPHELDHAIWKYESELARRR